MKAGLWALLMFLSALPAHASIGTTERMQDCVVLLHGLNRTSRSMNRLARELEADGYRVINQGYPSTGDKIKDLVPWVARAVAECGDARIHFVTHSMGGIVLRRYLALEDQPSQQMGRAVMLGPPNHGSEIVDSLGDWPVLQWMNGPALQELSTDRDKGPAALGPVTMETGVIAGDRCLNPLAALILPTPSDGKVSVSSTRLPGMRDHLVVHSSHTFMMRDREVMDQTRYFLRHGYFHH